MDLRNKHTDTIIELMRTNVAKGSPVNPPVWWIDPTDPIAHSIADGKLSNIPFSIRLLYK